MTSKFPTKWAAVVDKVQHAFKGLGKLVTAYHANPGTVNTASQVQYAYCERARATNLRRLNVFPYPCVRWRRFHVNVGSPRRFYKRGVGGEGCSVDLFTTHCARGSVRNIVAYDKLGCRPNCPFIPDPTPRRRGRREEVFQMVRFRRWNSAFSRTVFPREKNSSKGCTTA